MSDPSPAVETAFEQAVLVVDDNVAVTRALSELMRHAGIHAVGCLCGQEALDRTRETSPAAAVIDVHLPDINGLVLAQKLRERFGPTTPIIVVSGDTSMETINSLPHVGATYFFSKPLNPTRVIESLKQMMKP